MEVNMLLKMAWRSLLFRRGAIFITITAIAISLFTLLSIEHLRHTVKKSFTNTISGVDLIIGPRTGDINLLLTTVFRIGQPSKNISWQSYNNVKNHSNVAWSIPISLGDSHKGFRVIGTEPFFFTHLQYGSSRNLGFSEGKAFMNIDEIVLGATVARQLGYSKGTKITISHGISQTSFHTHDQFTFKVSGILRPTGTPIDNALYVSLQGLEAIHQPTSLNIQNPYNLQLLKPKNISAAFIGLKSKIATFKVQRKINNYKAEPLLAILPGVALTQLWQISRNIENVLSIMAKLILAASLLGLAAVMMATLRERNYELTVLRTLGAGPLTILCLIQIETLIISMMGVLLGTTVFLLSLFIFTNELTTKYGIDISISQLSFTQARLAIYLLCAAFTVSLLPALVGYLKSRNL